MSVPEWKFEMSATSFPIPEADGSNEDRIAEMYDEALSDLGNAIISNGEKEILLMSL